MQEKIRKETVPLIATGVSARWLKKSRVMVFCVSEALLLIVLYLVGTLYWYNRGMIEINNFQAAQSKVVNELMRKNDLVPNLLNVAREYAWHERALFKYVSNVRSHLAPMGKPLSAGGTDGSLEMTLSKLIALSEQYPELKAGRSYIDIMEMVETTEDRIASMQGKLNATAKEYNLCTQGYWFNFFTFPITPFMNLSPYIDYFQTESYMVPIIPLSALPDSGSGEKKIIGETGRGTMVADGKGSKSTSIAPRDSVTENGVLKEEEINSQIE